MTGANNKSSNKSTSKLPQGWFSRFEFVKGVAASSQLPADMGCEVAFAGRSNVGKSSALNRITQRKALARTSKSPGRTRELNYFRYDDITHLVDLPGYGYAKVNAAMQDSWAKLLEHYLSERQSLKGLFLIMDIRHPFGEFDQQMLEYARSCRIPVHILLNKADKLSRGAASSVLQQSRKDQLTAAETCQLFSALKGTGVEEAREKLARWLFPDLNDGKKNAPDNL